MTKNNNIATLDKNKVFENKVGNQTSGISVGEQLLKPEEVAKLLGISRETVYNWNYLEKLKPIRFSKRMIRYKYKDIIKLIEAREIA